MDQILVEPNPLLISRLGSNHNNGTVVVKNKGVNLILFRLTFDTEIFCGISPACGELEPNSSRSLNFVLEDFNSDIKEISFLIQYYIVLPNTEASKISELMMNQDKWKDSITAKIRFLTHAEEAMNSFSNAFKSKSSLNKAIESSKNINPDEKQLNELKKKLEEKEHERDQLKSHLESLKEQLEEQKKELEKYKNTNGWQDSLLFFGLLIFIVSLIAKRFI